jgi:ADP-L-glycero-D-manno-heptose 6-epimerase
MGGAEDKLIVVTGAAGFIGSGVVRHLNNQGRSNLILVDELGCTDKWKNLVGKQFVDIIHPSKLMEWLQGREQEIGAFIHLGACSSTVETDADYLLDNNTRYTISLAEYALKHGHRFIYASSAATYGDGSNGFSDDHDRLETLEPLNMYGYSKHLFDLWAERQGVLDRVVGLKYFNVFGPNEAHKGRMASAITNFFPAALKRETVKLFKSSEPERFGDGAQCRDFIYVKDAVRMTCDFLDSDVGGIFNVGRGMPGTWNTFAGAVFKALDQEPKITYVDMPEDLVGKYQNYTCADMNKFNDAPTLNGETLPLEEAVKDYVCKHLLTETRW